jgi:hypothetical protein
MPLSPEELLIQEKISNFDQKYPLSEEIVAAAKTISEKIERLPITRAEKQAYLERLIEPIEGKKRKWRFGTVAPYYNYRSAAELKIILDAMFDDQQHDRKILFTDQQRTASSLYAKVNQGWNFLIDKMDESGKYRFLRDWLRIRREEDGIALRWRDGIRERDKEPKTNYSVLVEERHNPGPTIEMNTPKPIEPEVPQAIWREKLDNFIESAENNKVLDLRGIQITEDQREGVRQLFEDLATEDFHLIILEPTRIKVFKGKLPERAL